MNKRSISLLVIIVLCPGFLHGMHGDYERSGAGITAFDDGKIYLGSTDSTDDPSESSVGSGIEMVLGNSMLVHEGSTAALMQVIQQAVHGQSVFADTKEERQEEKESETVNNLRKKVIDLDNLVSQKLVPVKKASNILLPELSNEGVRALTPEEANKFDDRLRAALLNETGSFFDRDKRLVQVLGDMGKRGVSFNRFLNEFTRKDRKTYLMFAAECGTPDMVKRLLQKEADPLCKDMYQRDAFFYALQNTKMNLRSDIMSELLHVACPEGEPATDVPAFLFEGACRTGNQILIDLLKQRNGIKISSTIHKSSASESAIKRVVFDIDLDANLKEIMAEEPEGASNKKNKKKKKRDKREHVVAVGQEDKKEHDINNMFRVNEKQDNKREKSSRIEKPWWEGKVPEQYMQEWELFITNGSFVDEQAMRKALKNFLAKKKRAEKITEDCQELAAKDAELKVDECVQESSQEDTQARAEEPTIMAPEKVKEQAQTNTWYADIESSISQYFSRGAQACDLFQEPQNNNRVPFTVMTDSSNEIDNIWSFWCENSMSQLQSAIRAGEYDDMCRAIIAGANPYLNPHLLIYEMGLLDDDTRNSLLLFFQECQLLAQEYREHVAISCEDIKRRLNDEQKLLESTCRQESDEGEDDLIVKADRFAARFTPLKRCLAERNAQWDAYYRSLITPACIAQWVAKEHDKRTNNGGSIRNNLQKKTKAPKHKSDQERDKKELADKWGILLREAARKGDCSAIDAFTYDFHKGRPVIQVAYIKPGVIENNPLGVEYYKNEEGNTVLSTAVQYGNIEFANALCETYPTVTAGALLFDQNNKGESIINILFDTNKKLVINEEGFVFDMRCLLPYEDSAVSEEHVIANSDLIFVFLQDALKKEDHKDSVIVFEFIKTILRARGEIKLPAGSYSVEDLVKLVRDY